MVHGIGETMEINIKLNPIAHEAATIRDKIKGGAIYGKSVDMDNPDHLIVAAYYLAKAEENKKTADDFMGFFVDAWRDSDGD